MDPQEWRDFSPRSPFVTRVIATRIALAIAAQAAAFNIFHGVSDDAGSDAVLQRFHPQFPEPRRATSERLCASAIRFSDLATTRSDPMMTRAAILRALAGALVMTTAASAQPVLIFAQTAWRAPNDFSIEIGQLFGQGLEAVPDIDGDGVTDLAISIVIPDSPGDPGVWIVSGATGDRLLSIDRANDDALVLQQALLHDKRDEERFLLAVLEADRDNEDARPTVVFANLPDGTI